MSNDPQRDHIDELTDPTDLVVCAIEIAGTLYTPYPLDERRQKNLKRALKKALEGMK